MTHEPATTQTADEAGIAAAKSVLRNAILLRRDTRPDDDRLADDEARMGVIAKHLAGRLPRTVSAYFSNGVEPGTLQLVAWLAARDVRVLLPVMSVRPEAGSWREPAWAVYEGPDSLRVGPFSILEPTGEILPGNAIADAEVVICPGLAANVYGERLGRGGGWYDRALPFASPEAAVWMLLNDDEVLETIPTDELDRRIDAIVTPTRFIDCIPTAA